MNEPTVATSSSRRVGTRWWWLVLLLTVIGATAGYAVSSSSSPVYQATTSILVGDSLVAPNISKDQIEASQLVASTYADLVRGQSVLEGVIQALGLQESWTTLQSQVHVSQGQNSPQLMLITVDGDTPVQARTIAQAVADELIALSPTSTSAGTAATGFVIARLHHLQRQISTGQIEVAALQQRLKTAVAIAAPSLRAQINDLQKLIIAWQSNYSSLAGLAATQRSTPNHLRVLQAAQADQHPVQRQIRIDMAIATTIGFLLGLGLVYVLEGRRRIRKRKPTAAFDDPPVDRYGVPWAASKQRRWRWAKEEEPAEEVDAGAGASDAAEEVSHA